jgi:hypothetical protein
LRHKQIFMEKTTGPASTNGIGSYPFEFLDHQLEVREFRLFPAANHHRTVHDDLFSVRAGRVSIFHRHQPLHLEFGNRKLNHFWGEVSESTRPRRHETQHDSGGGGGKFVHRRDGAPKGPGGGNREAETPRPEASLGEHEPPCSSRTNGAGSDAGREPGPRRGMRCPAPYLCHGLAGTRAIQADPFRSRQGFAGRRDCVLR